MPTNNRTNSTLKKNETFSIPSIIAIIAAAMSFATGAILGLIFACIAIIFGFIGVMTSLSPSKRGGIASTLSVGAGAVGIVAAILKALLWIF